MDAQLRSLGIFAKKQWYYLTHSIYLHGRHSLPLLGCSSPFRSTTGPGHVRLLLFRSGYSPSFSSTTFVNQPIRLDLRCHQGSNSSIRKCSLEVWSCRLMTVRILQLRRLKQLCKRICRCIDSKLMNECDEGIQPREKRRMSKCRSVLGGCISSCLRTGVSNSVRLSMSAWRVWIMYQGKR